MTCRSMRDNYEPRPAEKRDATHACIQAWVCFIAGMRRQPRPSELCPRGGRDR